MVLNDTLTLKTNKEIELANIQSLLESSISNIECFSPHASDGFSPRNFQRNESKLKTTEISRAKFSDKYHDNDKENVGENLPISQRRSSVKSKGKGAKVPVVEKSSKPKKKFVKPLNINYKTN